jgi:hypothetical protein
MKSFRNTALMKQNKKHRRRCDFCILGLRLVPLQVQLGPRISLHIERLEFGIQNISSLFQRFGAGGSLIQLLIILGSGNF